MGVSRDGYLLFSFLHSVGSVPCLIVNECISHLNKPVPRFTQEVYIATRMNALEGQGTPRLVSKLGLTITPVWSGQDDFVGMLLSESLRYTETGSDQRDMPALNSDTLDRERVKVASYILRVCSPCANATSDFW